MATLPYSFLAKSQTKNPQTNRGSVSARKRAEAGEQDMKAQAGSIWVRALRNLINPALKLKDKALAQSAHRLMDTEQGSAAVQRWAPSPHSFSSQQEGFVYKPYWQLSIAHSYKHKHNCLSVATMCQCCDIAGSLLWLGPAQKEKL